MKNHPYYNSILVSEDGQIFSSKNKELRKVRDNGLGYLFLDICEKGVVKKEYVHRLVAQTYIPNPENKPQVNHKDHNKQNNTASNLEWVTSKENHQYSWDNSMRDADGESNSQSILTETTVRGICEMLEDGGRNVDIAKTFSVPTYMVSDIRGRKTWASVSKDYDIKVNRKKRRSPNTVLKVAHLLEQGLTPKKIYKETGVGVGEIVDIRERRTHKKLTEDFDF